MPKLKYENNVNGQQIEIDVNRGECRHIACCSCGLDHLFMFEASKKKGKIAITIYRDDFRTNKLRKSEKFECVIKKK